MYSKSVILYVMDGICQGKKHLYSDVVVSKLFFSL